MKAKSNRISLQSVCRLLIVALTLVAALGSELGPASAAGPFLIILPGGSVTTTPGVWAGGAGTVYPYAFNVDLGDLTIEFHDINMSYSRLPLPVPASTCPTVWLAATAQGYIQTGVTTLDSVGPAINFSTGTWVNLLNIGYYLAQTWYNPGFIGPDPSAGLNSPYQAISNCGWNGPNHNDAAYDTFDQKVVFHKLTTGESPVHAGWYRITPYIRLRKTTDPSANPANVWLGYYDAGDCILNNGCRDIPPGTVDFTQVKPAVLVTNSDKGAGGATISWGSVMATGMPVFPVYYFPVILKNAGFP